jgi:hypothetical protein
MNEGAVALNAPVSVKSVSPVMKIDPNSSLAESVRLPRGAAGALDNGASNAIESAVIATLPSMTTGTATSRSPRNDFEPLGHSNTPSKLVS